MLSESHEVEKCICILQSSCMNMHSVDGKDYIASLPFQVNLSVLSLSVYSKKGGGEEMAQGLRAPAALLKTWIITPAPHGSS